MRALFGASQTALLVGIAALVLAAGLALAASVARNPLLARLAWRNVPRRPGFAALITLSLTLSTIVLSSAFTTGDTMSQAVRSVVAGTLGSADVVVFRPRIGASPGGFDLAQAVASGTLLTGFSDYFPAAEADRVHLILRDEPLVAGVLPVVLEQAPVAAPARAEFRARINLLGAPAGLAPGFDPPHTLDGRALSLADLADGEVYLNSAAASALSSAAGDIVRVFEPAGRDTAPADFRVRDVVRSGDLGGGQATMFFPLPRLQALTRHPDAINQILVANRGTAAERLRAAWPVTARLRAAYLDEATARRLYLALSAPAVRPLIVAAAERSAGTQADRLRLLAESLDAGSPSPEFKALVQDPEVVSRLAAAVPGLRRAGPHQPFGDSLGGATFRVLDVQRLAQDQAVRWGSAFTNVFVVLGLFSLLSGALLIVLVFSLLALERRGELGVMRALGGRRRDVVALLALEGALYSLVASAFGLLAGVGLGFGLVALAGGMVASYGFQLTPAVQPASLAVSYGLGVVLTFAAVTATAWHASRFSIVSAIRDLPPAPAARPGWRAMAANVLVLVAGMILVRQGLAGSWSLLYAGGVVLAISGAALLGRSFLQRAGLRGPERALATLAGLLLAGWWTIPAEWFALVRLPPFPRVIETSFLAGVSALLGSVWVIAYNVGLLRLVRGRSPLWRLSTAYLAGQRFRTGMTLMMFALVVLSLTLGAVLLAATDSAYGDPAAMTGGWDIRADGAGPPRDLVGDLSRSGVLEPSAFRAIGTTSALSAEAVRVDGGDARWRPITLTSVDAPFAQAAVTPLTGTVAGADGSATWRTLAERPGTALVGAGLLRDGTLGVAVEPSEGPGFAPVVLWVRDPGARRPAVRLEVVGVLDARGPFGMSLMVGPEALAGWPAAERATYYFAAPPGASVRELAAGLNLAIPELRALPVGEELRLIQGIRELLALILRGFMSVGLLAGVAALGLVSTRAVVERRRQIGVLRALGFRSRAIGAGLLLESALVTLMGALLGVGLGVSAGQGTLAFLARQNPELRFGVPWEAITLIVLLALLASLLMTLLPARRAARLSPAEALREPSA